MNPGYQEWNQAFFEAGNLLASVILKPHRGKSPEERARRTAMVSLAGPICLAMFEQPGHQPAPDFLRAFLAEHSLIDDTRTLIRRYSAAVIVIAGRLVSLLGAPITQSEVKAIIRAYPADSIHPDAPKLQADAMSEISEEVVISGWTV